MSPSTRRKTTNRSRSRTTARTGRSWPTSSTDFSSGSSYSPSLCRHSSSSNRSRSNDVTPPGGHKSYLRWTHFQRQTLVSTPADTSTTSYTHSTINFDGYTTSDGWWHKISQTPMPPLTDTLISVCRGETPVPPSVYVVAN